MQNLEKQSFYQKTTYLDRLILSRDLAVTLYETRHLFILFWKQNDEWSPCESTWEFVYFSILAKIHLKGKVRFSLHTSQVVHQAGAYPGFCCMKRLGVFLFPSG